MPSFEDLHLTPPVARALERQGGTPDNRALREAAPTAARGHNLVLVAPPAPAYAVPALAGMLSRLGGGMRGLLLGADAHTFASARGLVARHADPPDGTHAE